MTAAGNGGMIAVDDPEWFDRTLVNRRWGRRSETYLFGSRKGSDERFGPLADGTPYDLIFVFDDLGYNFEPSEIMAAYGLVQMDKLPEFNARRQRNFRALEDALADHDEKVTRPRTTPEVDTTWMRYPFLLGEGIDRTAAQEFFLERDVPTRMVWTGNILRQPGFASIPHRAPEGGLPNADLVMDRALSLPLHHGLTSDDMGHLVEALSDWARSI
jgi:CDP-6-deoxy-D-xylo-4-hexulose-3-dehydrase